MRSIPIITSFFRIQFFTICLTLIACIFYLLRKGIQGIKDLYIIRKQEALEKIMVIPISNEIVTNQIKFNNKVVNDKIVTSLKMFSIFAFVSVFFVMIYFYTKHFALFAHKANFVNFTSIFSRFVFCVIVPSIMYLNNSPLRNFVISEIRDCILK